MRALSFFILSIWIGCQLTFFSFFSAAANNTLGHSKIDSLFSLFANTENVQTKKILINNIVDFYQGETTNDTITNLLYEIEEHLSTDSGYFYLLVGKLYQNSRQYEQAKEYFDTAVSKFTISNNSDLYWEAVYLMGFALYSVGDYSKASDEFFRTLKYYESHNKWIDMAGVFNTLGIIAHRGEGDVNKALNYYQRAIDLLSKDTTDTGTLYVKLLTNMGLSYYELAEYKNAEQHFLEAIERNKVFNDPFIQLVNEGNLGLAYSGLGDYHQSEKYFKLVIEKSKKSGDLLSEAVNMGDLGRLYLKKSSDEQYHTYQSYWVNKAVHCFKESLIILYELKDFRRYLGYSLELSKAYELLGNYRQSLAAYQQHIYYRDSLYTVENTKETAKREIQYEFSRREDSLRIDNQKQLAIKDASLRARKQQSKLLLIGIGLTIVIIVLLFQQNRIRKKHNTELNIVNKELAEANQIKIKFFGILNHDLRSPISSIINLIKILQAKENPLDEITRERIQNQTINSAQSLLSAMDDLLLWSKSQMENFIPHPNPFKIAKLFKELKDFFQYHTAIVLEFHDPEQINLYTDQNYLKIITRNLTNNAIKATTQKENPTIIWKAFTENKRIILSITDNGTGGTDKDFQALYDDRHTMGIRTGLGLHLIRDLAKAIDCAIEVHSELGIGTTIRLIF
jgi:signal transduction histidine kinase